MSCLDRVDKKLSILVVDDFATMRKIIKGALRQLGFENVTEAEDGKIGLDKLNAGQFQLIISDWNMPQMMGIDLLKAVRADDRLKKLPFLMVTAEAQKENVLEAARAGASSYIVKPFTPDQLQSKLEGIFSKS